MKKKTNWWLFTFINIISILLLGIIVISAYTRPGILIRRIEIFVLVYLFLILHCFVEVKKIYDWIYKHRFLVVFCLFVFSVVNCFNGSSLGMYDSYIQPGEGTDLVSPILGRARAIRSDEWMVNVPRLISAEYSDYGALNSLVRATTSTNMVASGGLQLDYALLRDPSSWGYYLFGSEYGLSFQWSYRLLFGFLIWFELFLILTNHKKLLSLFGASLIWFSTFNLWWSIVTQLITGPAIVVLFYYFVREPNRIKRLFIGMGLAIAGADFACALYPAWQVPMGYIVLAMMAWILFENREWKSYKAKDWLVFIVDVAFMLSIIGRFIWLDMEYIIGISETVYPGARVEYGGFSINKLLGYLYVMLAFIVPQTNPCEMSCIAVAFPLGLILDGYVLYKQKGHNSLLICLSIPMLFLLMYCTVGIPPIIAKLTLMTYSTSVRAVDYLGVILAIIMIVCIGQIHNENEMSNSLAIFLAILTVVPSLIYCLPMSDNLIVKILVFLLALIMGVIIVMVLTKRSLINKHGEIIATVCLVSTGMLVNPIMVGTDAIFSKPSADAIQSIVQDDPNGRWVGLNSIVLPQYLLACGAPTLNSVNYIPNYQMWDILDPDRLHEEVWNRYAHMVVALSESDESRYELLGPDSMQMSLSIEDFEKLDISYVVSQSEISGKWDEILDEVYAESGIWIYKVIL